MSTCSFSSSSGSGHSCDVTNENPFRFFGHIMSGSPRGRSHVRPSANEERSRSRTLARTPAPKRRRQSNGLTPSPRKIVRNKDLANLFSRSTKRGKPKRKRLSCSTSLEPAKAFAIDRKPNDIELVGRLGSGATGNVYKLRHVQPCGQKKYALKVVEMGTLDRAFPAARDCIQNEMSILEDLRDRPHPRVVGIVDKLMDNDKYLYGIITEYVNGGTLRDMLDKKGDREMSEKDISVLSRKLLHALVYLQTNHIVHMDVKPANILVNKAGDDIKLADFGSSIVVDEGKAPDSYNIGFGTAKYLSPERFYHYDYWLKESGDMYKLDIWSLGICLLECSGCPDVQGDNIRFRVRMVTKGHVIPVPPPGRSEELQDFVRRCLRLQVSERPFASDLFWHPFIQKCYVVK